jgi:hypothetical protein
MQISVATGRVSFVAYGANPAVSPDSRYLAYATGREFNVLAVRDLRTGRTRIVNVEPLMGGSSSLLQGQTITWLGDGHHVVAIPQPDPVLVASPLASARAVGNSCGQQTSARGLCLVVADAGAAGLRADRVFAPVSVAIRPANGGSMLDGEPVLGADATSGQSLLIGLTGRTGGHSRTVVDAVNLANGRAADRRVATLPANTRLWAIAPLGDRVLYGGGTPSGLWTATLGPAGLEGPHLVKLPEKFGWDQMAW